MILVIRTAMVIERTSILLFLVLSGVRCRMHTPEDSLQMREGSPFKIALFADLHFGENAWTDWGPRQDLNSVRVMSDVLDKEKPDFVIYLGDIITANNIMIKNASLYWDQAVSPAKDRRIPWSIVFGNHDDAPFHWPTEWFSETGIPQLNCSLTGDEECSFRPTTRLELIKNETDNNSILSHSKKGPQSLWPSVSNYALKLSSSRNPDKAAAFLYFLDSGGGSYPEVISKSQLKWFKEKAEELNPDSSVAEILFWHIPSKIFKKVAPTLKKRNIKCTGSMFSEEVTPQEAEMGIMKVLEERTSIKAVFVGHNHGLDWCCPYKKMWLCFARHTGYGGYGNWSRGARILEIINEKPFSLKSWIKMEDGKTQSEVLLTNQNDISRK